MKESKVTNILLLNRCCILRGCRCWVILRNRCSRLNFLLVIRHDSVVDDHVQRKRIGYKIRDLRLSAIRKLHAKQTLRHEQQHSHNRSNRSLLHFTVPPSV